jgi:Protein of unknown function (DUF2510)
MGRYGTSAETTEPAALPAAVLSAGWYPDPYLRWKARFWDGRLWTERVAGPGRQPTMPVFGHDPVAPPARADLFVVDPTLVRIVEAMCTAELAHLRTEVETWRGVADERARALAKAFNALESLVADRRQHAPEPTERNLDPVDGPAARSALVSVPDAVRMVALSELQTMTLKRRRWWRRS